MWRREKIDAHGEHFDIPLTRERGGSGLGKPLKLINTPVRDQIPMMLAALGPKNVELAAELFEAWEPIFYLPERADDAFGAALAAGKARRDPTLPPLDITADTRVLISQDPDEVRHATDQVKAHLALYIGGMGGREGQGLLQRLRHQVRVRRGSRAGPGPVPGRQEDGGSSGNPRGPGRKGVSGAGCGCAISPTLPAGTATPSSSTICVSTLSAGKPADPPCVNCSSGGSAVARDAISGWP